MEAAVLLLVTLMVTSCFSVRGVCQSPTQKDKKVPTMHVNILSMFLDLVALRLQECGQAGANLGSQVRNIHPHALKYNQLQNLDQCFHNALAHLEPVPAPAVLCSAQCPHLSSR